MALFSPTDTENGWDAWDYARAILYRLECIERQVGEDGQPATLGRFLTNQGQAWDGAATERTVRFTVPPGVTWRLISVLGFSGDEANAPSLVLYRGEQAPSNIMDVAGGGSKGIAKLASILPVDLGENTVVVVRVIMAAAPAANLVPTVNLVVEQTPLGRPPKETQGGGEF